MRLILTTKKKAGVKRIPAILIPVCMLLLIGVSVYGADLPADKADIPMDGYTPGAEAGEADIPMDGYPTDVEAGEADIPMDGYSADTEAGEEIIEWDENWPYASYSEIHTGTPVLYRVADGNGYTVCVNAGHGTQGGAGVQTMCHPDGSPKVTGGSTAAGSVYATAVSSGTVMLDGTPEAAANLQLAQILKEKLMAAGFHVLMIRDSEDVQLDNIARTVMANENADCHLAIHYDSTASGKGFFYVSVPSSDAYRSMEPVASHWQEHNALGEAVLAGVIQYGNPVCGSGSMEIDLTQTSYSTIPSIDMECGDTASDWSYLAQERLADGIVAGVQAFFGLTG